MRLNSSLRRLTPLTLALATLALVPACDSEQASSTPAGSGPGGKADATGDAIEVRAWVSAINFFPASLDYEIASNSDANACELFVDRLGDGSFTNGGTTNNWYQAELVVADGLGEIRNAGMYVDAVGTDYLVVGRENDDGGWETGFPYFANRSPSIDEDVVSFAFFVDVEAEDGSIDRYWQSASGENFDPHEVFRLPTDDEALGGGQLRWANEGASVFDQKRACASRSK